MQKSKIHCPSGGNGLSQNVKPIPDINTDINHIEYNNSNIYDFLEENGFALSPIHYEIISKWEDNELTRYAIRKAVLNNKYNINYIDKILYNWEKENIKTIQQAKELEEEFNNKKDNYYKSKYQYKESRYEETQRKIEEWLKDE
jgi:DnaD/phage-associated family protein